MKTIAQIKQQVQAQLAVSQADLSKVQSAQEFFKSCSDKTKTDEVWTNWDNYIKG